MNRLSATAVVLILIGGSLWWVQADDAAAQKAKKELMRQKLVNAQMLLEGLALQNFAKLEKEAVELQLVSKKAEWAVTKTPEYTRFSEEFRRYCADIEAAAKKKNIDAATLSYLKLTTTCVECHKYLRETKIASLLAPETPVVP